MYHITFVASRQLISVKLTGLFSAGEVERYVADLRDRFLRHRFKAGYLMLIDTSECTIQPQDVLLALQEHMASFPKASRIAVVTGSSLARMQVRRVMHQPYLRIVATAREGHQWLFASEDAAEPAVSAGASSAP